MDTHPAGEGIVLLVFTHGRPEPTIHATLESFDRRVFGPVAQRFIVHDGVDQGGELLARYGDRYTVIAHGEQRGFAAAIATGWQAALGTNCRWVFHLEDDFTFNRDLALSDMTGVLREAPYLAQMALRRQAWNAAEIAAGGVIEQHPECYQPMTDGRGTVWLEHRLFWTTNPSVYRRETCELGWPQEPQSEGLFTHRLLESDPDLRFGYLGRRSDAPWVHHCAARTGSGY